MRCVPIRNLVFTLLVVVCRAATSTPPNIVLVYGDDVGYGDLGCYGAELISTPNIDELAEHGLRFTSGYCTSATCTPSRYSLLTGTYAWRTPGTGIAPPNCAALIKPGKATLASVLQGAGYRTGIVGKWHLGLGKPPKPDWSGNIQPGPLEAGFESSFIIPTTNDRVPCVYVRGHRVVNLDPKDPLDVFDKNPDGQPTGITHRYQLTMDWSHGHNDSIVNGISRIGFMTGGHDARWTDETMALVLTAEAKRFIEQSDDRPFFLYYSAHQIHVPRVPNKQFVGHTTLGPRGDAVVELDWCVGEIVNTLRERDLLANTLIFITSDNGPVLDDGYRDEAVSKLNGHKPAGPFRGGKYSRFEGGTRVPWLVHWPARVEPGVSDAIVSQIDLFRTLAVLAGVENLPDDVAANSIDLSAALCGDDSRGRRFVVQHSGTTSQLAIRRGKWKFIEPARGAAILTQTNTETGNLQETQLYDLTVDPGEVNNLANKRPEVVAELTSLLQSIRNSPQQAKVDIR